MSIIIEYLFVVEHKQIKLKLASKRRRAKQDDHDQTEETEDHEEALYANDTFPLPYVRIPMSRATSKAAIREFNAQGFGAGGLPPFCFSHLNRNWAQVGVVTCTDPRWKGWSGSPYIQSWSSVMSVVLVYKLAM